MWVPPPSLSPLGRRKSCEVHLAWLVPWHGCVEILLNVYPNVQLSAHGFSQQAIECVISPEKITQHKATTSALPPPRALAVAREHDALGVQKEDLGRMYRLFSRIAGGLTPVAESFKRHVESEGSRLVKEVTEAASQKKDAGLHFACPATLLPV